MRKCQLEETYEEVVAPRATEPTKEVAPSSDDEIPKEHDMLESQEPLHMNISHKRKPAWVREIIQEVERYGALEGSIRKINKPKPFPSNVALMCELIDKYPTCFEVFVQNK